MSNLHGILRGIAHFSLRGLLQLLHSATCYTQQQLKKAPEAKTFCSLIYMPRKLLINPSKLILQCGNEPLQHYLALSLNHIFATTSM